MSNEQILKWIPISEKKPLQNSPVLIAKYDGRKHIEMYFVVLAERSQGTWTDVETGADIMGKGQIVTHWMNLPDPPEKID